ncbi:hypothetical protein SH501x_002338 [Pirellulaceae bacterium SH501]
MASAEVNPPSSSQPVFWSHLLQWIRSIPRSAILSMVGPSLLLVLGYFGWRFYGAKHYDAAFYGIEKTSIVINSQPAWLKTSIVDQVFADSGIGKLSMLDSQTPAMIARAFDAHPAIRKTHRVEPRAGGQVFVSVEYRIPVGMVHLPADASDETGRASPRWLPVDGEGVLLPTVGFFEKEDVLNYIHIFASNLSLDMQRKVGTPFGDPKVEDAAKLCALLASIREQAKIVAVYVHPAPMVEKTRWLLEIETQGGPRILWGSAPGMESIHEPSFKDKYSRLKDIASNRDEWSKGQIDLSR